MLNQLYLHVLNSQDYPFDLLSHYLIYEILLLINLMLYPYVLVIHDIQQSIIICIERKEGRKEGGESDRKHRGKVRKHRRSR